MSIASTTHQLPDNAAEIVRDPALYSRWMLKHDPWELQERILRALAEPRALVAVKSCHSSGKTFIAADAVVWWVVRWKEGKAITTARSWTQVEQAMWGNIRKAIRGGLVNLPEPNQTDLKLSEVNWAMGLSTNEPDRFHGHKGQVLIVVDEAQAMAPWLWEAMEGIRAGGDVRVLLIGNPLRASGPLYEAFKKQRARWKLFTVSAFDTPNFDGLYPGGHEGLTDEELVAPLLRMSDAELDANPRDYLATRRWVREQWESYGPGTLMWDSKVMGRFPTQSDDALIALSWLEAADRDLTATAAYEHARPRAGVDVAGPGEAETVAVVRRGPQILARDSWPHRDARGEVAAFLAPWQKQGLEVVNVDSIGMGWYFALHLDDLHFPVVPVNVQETEGVDTERFRDQKSWFYWGLRQRYKDGEIGGQTDDEAIAQLAALRYQHDPRGRVVIESKKDAAKRGEPSPDRAEAEMLAFAPTEPPVYGEEIFSAEEHGGFVL